MSIIDMFINELKLPQSVVLAFAFVYFLNWLGS